MFQLTPIILLCLGQTEQGRACPHIIYSLHKSPHDKTPYSLLPSLRLLSLTSRFRSAVTSSNDPLPLLATSRK